MWRLPRLLLEMCMRGHTIPRVELPWSVAAATTFAATATATAVAAEVVDEVSVVTPTRAVAPEGAVVERSLEEGGARSPPVWARTLWPMAQSALEAALRALVRR
jgi:hypothetical protein